MYSLPHPALTSTVPPCSSRSGPRSAVQPCPRPGGKERIEIAAGPPAEFRARSDPPRPPRASAALGGHPFEGENRELAPDSSWPRRRSGSVQKDLQQPIPDPAMVGTPGVAPHDCHRRCAARAPRVGAPLEDLVDVPRLTPQHPLPGEVNSSSTIRSAVHLANDDPVNSRELTELRLPSRSWAAARMPTSGFRTSWARRRPALRAPPADPSAGVAPPCPARGTGQEHEHDTAVLAVGSLNRRNHRAEQRECHRPQHPSVEVGVASPMARVLAPRRQGCRRGKDLPDRRPRSVDRENRSTPPRP